MVETSKQRFLSQPFLILLFASGFASLMYEVLWTRVLLSTFGATVYASGTVLTSFMAGLALGSYLSGRLLDRIPLHPLRIYGWLELFIGIYALAFPFLLKGITVLHISAFRELGTSFYLFSLIRFILAFLVLIIPAALMGATLPVITRHGIKRLGDLGNKLGRLYAVNTIGAALGTFLTGYIFIEHLGIRNTTWLAVLLNVLIFIGALGLAGIHEKRETAFPGQDIPPVGKTGSAPKKGKAKKPVAETGFTSLPPGWLLLTLIAISGYCALSYEVLWSRILVYILGNFVHSFSLMLTTFLVGIALGSYLLGRFVDRFRHPVRILVLFQVLIGLAAIFILPIFTLLIGARDNFLASLSGASSLKDYHDPWWTFTAWKLGVTFLLMLGPTLMMGASFPLVSKLYIQNRDKVARGVGSIYAANTSGGILGAFAASFLLIPLIGLRSAALLTALLNMTAAAVLFVYEKGRYPLLKKITVGVTLVLVGVLSFQFVPGNIFHPIFASVEKGKELIYVDEAVSGTVTIHATPGGFKVIDINGLNVAGTKFGFLCTQKLQAHFPLLMHHEPKQIMQIGFGTGGTCYSISTHPEVERIDCVEINPGIIKAAHFFEENNHDILADPRVSVTIEDARNFVLTTDKHYDVILSDSIHPRFTGNGLLYTKDYFDICARVLKDDGIFSTWLPTAYLGDEEFRTIVRSMQATFPHILIWYMNNTVEGYTITMGSNQPFRIDWDRLEERINEPVLAGDLRQVHVDDIYEFLDLIIISGDNVAEYLGPGLWNTEDRPIIEFRAPRNMNREITEFRNLERMMKYRNFPAGVISSWGVDEQLRNSRQRKLGQFYQGTGYLLQAHQFHLFGRFKQEKELLRKALEINPADRDAVFLIERMDALREGRRLDW